VAWLWITAAAVALTVWAGFALRTVPATVDPGKALAESEQIIVDAGRVLVVAAHPDDVEWYVGGTLARLVDAGADITVVMATDGERGRGPKPGLGETRRQEQIESARRLGPVKLVFLGLPDGGLGRSAAELEDRVGEVWRETAPDLVFAFDPDTPQLPYVHSDHMAAGTVALETWRELESPAVLWLFHTRRPNVFVDATAEGMVRKLHALAAHRTQMAGGHGADRLLRGQGRRFGALVGVEYAEAYRAVAGSRSRQG